ncbi:MAG: oxidoreductase [Robiginitomaculum sp.]|nr:MAG: oxidoreductase [Robiginitomaculum sp.]
MSVIVTDTGFVADDTCIGFTLIAEISTNMPVPPAAIDMTADDHPEMLSGYLSGITFIRIHFAAFDDGRGFTLARRLRLMGFTGRLRAKGYVIAEQYAMARRAGFDEVEISDALARRQPENLWKTRANWTAHDYQSKLCGAANSSFA